MNMKAILAAGLLAVMGSAANAVTFTLFDSTNASQLNPEVVITDNGNNTFTITTELFAPEFGDLGAIYLDIGGGLSDAQLGTLALTSIDPSSNDPADFSYEFANGIDATSYNSGVCSNDLNLSGSLTLPNFEGVGCLRSKGANQPNDGVNPVEFLLSDVGGLLTEDSFLGVGLRYKSSSNDEGSDKLFSSTPNPIPVPAAGWLLIAGLGGLAAMKHRKS